ncbi:MAG: preprotein translocase subunit SecE [Motilibacteraceae bacterium]|jgi:preprotein translocase subunit SecE
MTETRDTTAAPERERGASRRGGSASPLARLSLFYRQIVAELRKVIWPTRKELVTYTSVVVVFVCIVIAYVSLLDFGFGQAVLHIFG